MSGSAQAQAPVARIVRAREGRWLGGVCAGLPDGWRLGRNGIRLLFVIAALFGGIGVVAYLACWLVIPAADQDPEHEPVRTIVVLAWAAGCLVVLVLIGAGAALATVFGLGWVVFALAAVVASLGFSPLRRRIPTIAALLTLAALTLPAMAVALSPLRLTFQSGQSVARPRTYGALGQTVYRSGFGTLLIDLRRTPVRPGDTTLRIDAGLRRTIVALPSSQCVRVHINYDIHLFPARLAALFTGRPRTEFHDVLLFGRPYGYGVAGGSSGSVGNLVSAAGPRPLLTIDFTSQGGGLYVRDYPDTVDPELHPAWPGYPVALEPHPYLRNEPRRLWRPILRAWHRRLALERPDQEYVDRHLRGPCARTLSVSPAGSVSSASGTGTLTIGRSGHTTMLATGGGR